jgi:hypothetical protein
LRNVLVYWFFFVLSVRLLWEDGQCIGRPGEKKLNYVLLCFIKLQSKPKCHGIDTIMYNSLIPFANFGSSQYSILWLIAIHNLACSYVISAVHNIRGKSSVMSKYFVWSLRVWYILVNSGN